LAPLAGRIARGREELRRALQSGRWREWRRLLPDHASFSLLSRDPRRGLRGVLSVQAARVAISEAQAPMIDILFSLGLILAGFLLAVAMGYGLSFTLLPRQYRRYIPMVAPATGFLAF